MFIVFLSIMLPLFALLPKRENTPPEPTPSPDPVPPKPIPQPNPKPIICEYNSFGYPSDFTDF